MGIWICVYTEAVSESMPRPPLLHPSLIMSWVVIDTELEESKLGSLNSPERCALMQSLLVSLRLSFPASSRDMPFSFCAPRVMTGADNGSVGHLGLLHAKRRDINVNAPKKTAQWQSEEALHLSWESQGP